MANRLVPATIYTVRARECHAVEMARYEGSTIVSKSDPDPDPIFVGTQFEEQYTTYLFVISNPNGLPNIRRWASFGVTDIKY